MSASTRTTQQPLGFGQLGAALVAVAVAILVAVAIAFGSLGATKADVTPGHAPAISVGVPPDAADVTRGNAPAISVGVPPDAIDHGARDDRGTTPAVGGTGFQGDPGFAPRTNGSSRPGATGPRMRPN